MTERTADPAFQALMAGVQLPAGLKTAQLLRAIAVELADAYWERSAVVRSLVAAILAGQHSLLLGPGVIHGFSSREPSFRRSYRCCD